VQVADVPDAERVTATNATASFADSTGVVAPTINRGAVDQVRGKQMSAVESLESAARGDAPSEAEELLKSGMQSVISGQRSMAAGARGQNTAGAARRAAREITRAGMGFGSQQAAMRAKEMADARGALVGALANVRGDDQGLATTEAGMRLDADKFTAGAANSASQFNAGVGTEISKFNAGQNTSVAEKNADRSTQNTQFKVGESNRASTFNAGQTNQRREKQGEMQLSAETGNADRHQRGAIVQGEITSRERLTDAGAANKRATDQAGLTQQNRQFNTGQKNTVAVGNADRTVTGRGLDDRRRSELRTDVRGATKDVAEAERAEFEAEQQNKAIRRGVISNTAKSIGSAVGVNLSGDPSKSGGGGGGGDAAAKSATGVAKTATGGAGGGSDVRMKKNISPADDAIDNFLRAAAKAPVRKESERGDGEVDIDGFLAAMADEIDPIAFDYRDGDLPWTAPGRRFGLAAQDLEKSGPVGKSIVRDTPHGKVLDVGQAIGPILAGMASLRRDLDKVKGKRA
jgi:hypothetical protein